MAISIIDGISITGICSVIPKTEILNQSLSEFFNDDELERIIASTGIASRRVLSDDQTIKDLQSICSEDLLSGLNVSREEIGLVVCITQTPDSPFPGNAIQLQHSLGLPKSAIAFDVNLGCSGFVYGLWQVSSLLKTLAAKKALLIVGDGTTSQYSNGNKLVNTLFGDAASAVLLEKTNYATPMYFDLGNDGSGAPYLRQPNNGASKPNTCPELTMDGTQVFAFTLREVPKSIKACLHAADIMQDEIDYLVMHQANEMMMKHLGDKLKFTQSKIPIDVAKMGNTSSCSIPLAICNNLSNVLTSQSTKLLLSGFGVGWSWATAVLDIHHIKYCATIDLKDRL